MLLTMLKSKIHRATVSDADLEYEGSISIDTELCRAAKLKPWEKVEIYDCTNGERFSTYVIAGKSGEICLNGAAARKVHRGDIVIIASYLLMDPAEAEGHRPVVVQVDESNALRTISRPESGF